MAGRINPFTFTLAATFGFPGSIRSVDESLERYGTNVFGIEYMQARIRAELNEGQQLDVAPWFMTVPVVYRQECTLAIAEAFEPYKRQLATRQTLHSLIADIHRAIWRMVDPDPEFVIEALAPKGQS